MTAGSIRRISQAESGRRTHRSRRWCTPRRRRARPRGRGAHEEQTTGRDRPGAWGRRTHDMSSSLGLLPENGLSPSESSAFDRRHLSACALQMTRPRRQGAPAARMSPSKYPVRGSRAAGGGIGGDVGDEARGQRDSCASRGRRGSPDTGCPLSGPGRRLRPPSARIPVQRPDLRPVHALVRPSPTPCFPGRVVVVDPTLDADDIRHVSAARGDDAHQISVTKGSSRAVTIPIVRTARLISGVRAPPRGGSNGSGDHG